MEAGPQTLLDKLIASAGMDPGGRTTLSLVRRLDGDDTNLTFNDRDASVSYEDRFVNSMAALLANIDLTSTAVAGVDAAPRELLRVDSIRTLMIEMDALASRIDDLVQDRLQRVVQSESLRALETSWRSLENLCNEVTSDEVIIDFVDADKELLRTDFEDNSSYILNSALFRKVYIDEYDRYGGRPIGAMIGLYEFDSSDEDIDWLQTMSKICAAAHCPFIAAVSPGFFKVATWEDLERKTDLEELMAMPQFGRWNAFRSSHGAAYIGLTLPRYLLRTPYDQVRGKNQIVDFAEKIAGPKDYLWGNAAVLFARNLVRSFQISGWCQHVVGPLSGGLIKGLPVHTVMHHGQGELQPPVELAIADYRELQFANAGFIPLIHCKGSADATFFSARSVKKALEFESDLDTKNADLVCNLAYTLSITRIAHYVKRMVRDYIGSTADAPYIKAMLEAWLVEYVTTAVNPDDLTLLYYPFKGMSVNVEPKPGPFGWYNCVVSVLPHVQFQGMDVELRLEAALGGA
jgi:type VI secretion system protein ImpC